MQIVLADYTSELAEIAAWSEWGCATFDIKKLSVKQYQAIQVIIGMSWSVNWGDIEYGEYTVRIINHTLWRFVTVIPIPQVAREEEIY